MDESSEVPPESADSGEDTTGKPVSVASAASGRKRFGRRFWASFGTFLLGFVGLFLIMAHQGHLPFGVYLGLFSLMVTVAGLFGCFDLFRAPASATMAASETWLGRRDDEPLWMAPRVTIPATFLLTIASAALGSHAMPYGLAAAMLALLPSAPRRPGFFVFSVAGLLYLPFFGSYGLWDPWETHYGEVAREILSRDDWISLWWAHENWFWSKPILIFWTEALSMLALGVDYLPDANPAHPEWAIRLPVIMLGMGAIVASYAAMRRVFGTRAGVLSGLVLATTPHFFFLTHQAITDMFWIGDMVIAMSLLVIATTTDPKEVCRPVIVSLPRIGEVSLSLRHLILFAISATVLPQAVYILTRNVTLVAPFQFHWHPDEFLSGSTGNAGLPGHAEQHVNHPAARLVLGPIDFLQPVFQGAVWLVGLFGLLAFLRNEHRRQSYLMLGFYLFCGLGFIGKGIPGVALPGLVALFFLIGTGRFRLLLSGQLRVGLGVLTVSLVALPWYVAMLVRHGRGFFNRFFIHDHVNRLASGVHGDETAPGTIGYFLTQLGYATFPWAALVPAALLLWLSIRHERQREQIASGAVALHDDEIGRQFSTLVLLAIWFFAGFTLFSAMKTKFHHYIAPVVPAAALLVGLVLDRMFGPPVERGIKGWAVSGMAVLSAVLLVFGVGGRFGGLRGVIDEGVEGDAARTWILDHGMSPVLAYALMLGGLLLLGVSAYLGRKLLTKEDEGASTGGDAQGVEPMAVVLIAGAFLVAFIGRDLSWVTDERPQGYERLMQLFSYNYGRLWPEQFDYRPILTGFAIVSTFLVAVSVVRPVRAYASRALLGVSMLFTAWCLNIYLVDLAPHWGQRELVERYFEERQGADEPLVAWQMNWKGENFYTGNRVLIFVDLDNRKVREWVEANEGSTAFFVLEHARLGSFRNVVRGHEVEELTTVRDCNKFILVRVSL